jgi:hypothetical protein
MKNFSPLLGGFLFVSNMESEVGSITATTIYTGRKAKKLSKKIPEPRR